ncbi:unnamed protein product [Eretmochelys imbricata]
MGPAAGVAESEEPLQELCVNGNGHLETGGNPDPPWNCQKSPTCGVVVALIVVSSPLIAAIIALAVLTSQLSSADLCPLLAPSARTTEWDTEGNATISQRRKGAGPTAGAAAVHRVPPWLASTVSRKWVFLLRHKGVQDHWIGLRREQGQPWIWTNSTKFNHLFHLRGGGDCTYLNDQKGVSSSRCYMGRRWICSKPEVYVMVS